MNRKILITGGSGLLGQYLNIECCANNTILTCYNKHIGNCNNFDNVKIDITDFDSVKEVFHSFQPDIVIHAAAITNTIPLPDQNPKDVYKTNVQATKYIAELCEKMKSKLIYGLGAIILLAAAIASALAWTPVAEVDRRAIHAAAQARNVTIHRDTWGVPHIFGKTDADVAFGLGYAQSEDDFDTLALSLAMGRGELAKFQGADAGKTDYLVFLFKNLELIINNGNPKC